METYTLELTEDELVYLKLLVGKQSGKAKTDLFKEVNEVLNKFDTDFIQSILFFQQFSEKERQAIGWLAKNYYYKHDKIELYKKLLELSRKI